MRISYRKELRGHHVIDATGRILGEVEEIFVDAESWKVEGFRLKLRREAADALGAAHTALRPGVLEIPAEAIQSVGQAILLRIDAMTLAPPAQDKDRKAA
jgi:sporulation protein YlmC with PRC-barrel domain